MAKRIGFVGLGTMGAPMAGHLLREHGPLTVWNRTRGRALGPWGLENAIVAPEIATLGAECEIVFLCVNRTEDVRECLDGLTSGARPGTLFVDHSTIAPSAAEAMHAELAAKGFRFVDAPVTGGSMGAQKGQLTIFCGGSPSDVSEAIETMQPYTKRAERVGGPGAGQRMKMANQIAVAGSVLALCECLAFASHAGLDLVQAREMIGGGAGGSWSFENYGPKILARDWTPGFSVKNQRKDLAYCLADAATLGAAVPGVELVDSLLARLEEAGRGEETTVALFELLASGRES